MKVYHCFIVDDEPLAIDELRFQLQAFPKLKLVGSANSITDAQLQIEDKKAPTIDILFLDMQVGKELGFDLLHRLENLPKHIIAVTAYEKFAYQAFEFNCIDYILKPIDENRLFKAVFKVLQKGDENSSNNAEKLDINKKILLKDQKNSLIVTIQDIASFEAIGNYIIVTTINKKKISIYKTLKSIEEKLSSDFIRINRSCIINLQHVEQVNFNQLTIQSVTMKTNETFTTTQQTASHLKDALSL